MTRTGASLTFLPWVRQGVASAIPTPETLSARQPGAVDMSVTVKINGSSATPMTVRLRGPADVIGIDVNQVIRMDPPPGTTDFEPNYFPLLEFDRADFPWLFTPAKAGANAKLRPWLCLVVVRKQDGVTLRSAVNSPLPMLEIPAFSAPVELPDLSESWAWAHAQAAGAGNTPDAARTALGGAPELSLSRLICPRILKAETEYIACVVPTFDLGRRAGLGLPIPDRDLTAASALAPAWSRSPAPTQPVILPVYHHWEFRTGSAGDFKSLAARLRPRAAPPQLGQTPIDISRPGFALPRDFPTSAALNVEGALRPIPPQGTLDTLPNWPERTEQTFKDALAAIINTPGLNAAIRPTDDPILAAPIYGDRYAGRTTVARTGATWLDQLNLDPRLRSVAAYGTRVIQQHQEALMASAWEQAGEVQPVNQRMRQLQMSLVVGNRLSARHFVPLPDDAMLRVSAPALSRIGLSASASAGALSMRAQVKLSSIPLAALSPAMRRIGRARGPMTRRVIALGGLRSASSSWVADLDVGAATLQNPSWFDLVTTDAVSQHMSTRGIVLGYASVTDQVVAARGGAPWFVVRAEGQPVPIAYSFSYGLPSYDSPSARAFRAAAVDHLKRVNPSRTTTGNVSFIPPALVRIREGLTQWMRPAQSISALAQRVVSVASAGDPTSQRRLHSLAAVNAAIADIDTITITPTFPQPMYETLRDLSPDLLAPGLDSVPPDTVLGLETNRRFIESYMVGLNVEMGRELLWRGFPTNQFGTYFEHFWGAGPDIEPLHQWANKPLGDSSSNRPHENFVMLMRSALLRRFPNALIYLARAVMGAAPGSRRVPSDAAADEKPPIFTGSVQSDIFFVGFNMKPREVSGADGQLGYYIVIQQHPTEPRFGLDADVSVGGASHLSVSAGAPSRLSLNGVEWGRSAAHMARIVQRLPVRLAIHASQFL